MKSLKSLIVIAVAVLIASSVLAQRGQGGMMRMGGDASGTMLLQRKDVQADLGLSDDQKTKLAALRDKAQSDMRDIFQNSNGDREAAMAAMQKYMENMQKEVGAIVTKEQVARLKEINIQISGSRSAMIPAIQKEIGLSDAQVAKLKGLQAKQQEANQALFQKMRDQEITREELQEAMKKNSTVMDTEVAKVLTDGQKAKLKTMGGKEFKADPNEKGGFGGGGG